MTNNGMNFDLNTVRLQHAVLCAGCDVISNSPHDACLVCGSRSLLPLARVLGAAERTSLAIKPEQRETQVEATTQVLVLVPSMPHRPRQRVHPRV